MEPSKSRNLQHEYDLLLQLQDTRKPLTPLLNLIPHTDYQIAGFPKVYWYGRERSHNILVLELLDKNLESITTSTRHSGKATAPSSVSLSMMTILLIID